MLEIELPVEVRKLHGVGDGLDLVVQPSDVGVGDVRHLFEDELLHLRPGQLLHQEPGAWLHEHRVTGSQLHADEGVGELGDPLLVGPPEDDRPPAVLQHLLDHHDLAGPLEPPGQDHVQRLVEDHLVPALEVLDVDVGMQRDPHLAPSGEHVDGSVVVGPEVCPVGRRRLGQLLHLLAQGGHVLLGRLEGEGQLLVLRDGLGELALGLEQLLLERLDPPRALLQPATEEGHLLLGRLGAHQQRVEIVAVVACRASAAPDPVEVSRFHHLVPDAGPTGDPTPEPPAPTHGPDRPAQALRSI